MYKNTVGYKKWFCFDNMANLLGDEATLPEILKVCLLAKTFLLYKPNYALLNSQIIEK